MARYIDADLIKNIEPIPYKRASGNINAIIANVAIVGAKQVVDEIPTADVAPITHAHWIKDDNEQCYCSACMDDHHRPMFFTPHPQWKYCPWCGAKMDEE